MIKGINGWTFPAGTPWGQAALQAESAGFRVLEPVLTAGGELSSSADEPAVRAIGDAIRNAGLEVGALACSHLWQTPFSSPDRETRNQAWALTLAALDRASWLGAPVLLVVAGVVGRWDAPVPAARYEDALAHAHEALRGLAYEAEKRNVMLAVENVWSRFLLSPVEFRELIDRVNSSWVRVCLDVGNVLKFGYPQDWIEALGARIVRVHVRDFRLATGTSQGFCLPGEGDVDWAAVMAALRRIRYDGPLTYEGRGELGVVSAALDRILSL